MIAAVAILTFVWTWNNLLLPLFVMSNPSLMTIPVGLATVQGSFGLRYADIQAGAILAALPLVVLYMFFQRQIIKGIATTGIAGLSIEGQMEVEHAETAYDLVAAGAGESFMAKGILASLRTEDRVSDGYWTTATWRVSEASRRTVRSTTSSRSMAPSRRLLIARRSAGLSGLSVLSRSTNTRYPASVGMRPALVCGAAMRPSSSRTAMSLRTVAAETPSWWRSSRALDPTGSEVST